MSENSCKLVVLEYRGEQIGEALSQVAKLIAPDTVVLGREVTAALKQPVNGHALALPTAKPRRKLGRPRKVKSSDLPVKVSGEPDGFALPTPEPSKAKWASRGERPESSRTEGELSAGKKQKISDQMEALIRKYGPLRAEELALKIGITANGVKRSLGHAKDRFWMDEDEKFHIG
jgi:hypothetical protein